MNSCSLGTRSSRRRDNRDGISANDNRAGNKIMQRAAGGTHRYDQKTEAKRQQRQRIAHKVTQKRPGNSRRPAISALDAQTRRPLSDGLSSQSGQHTQIEHGHNYRNKDAYLSLPCRQPCARRHPSDGPTIILKVRINASRM